LIRAVKPPGKAVIARLLQQTPVGKQSAEQSAAIVNQALRPGA
jgi:hypothetical protein